MLSDDPDIGQLLLDAGYQRLANPGAFLAPNGVEIDVMVPEGAAGASARRSVALPGQSRFTARRTPGLELALLDADSMFIEALDESDDRAIELRVAGPAALTVAKLVKLEERLGGPRRDRIISKDAGDLLRLLRFCDAEVIGARLAELAAHDHAALVAERAISFLRAELAQPASSLVALTVEDRAPNETDRQVADAIRVLGRRLLEAYSKSR